MKPDDFKEPQPPVFRSWSGWYRLLLVFTVIQFILYYVLTLTLNKP
jgi:hypothetical protein